MSDSSVDDSHLSCGTGLSRAKLRIWPLFLVSILVGLSTILVQLMLVVTIAVVRAAGGQVVDEGSMTALLMTAPMFVINLITTGVCMVGGAVLFGWLSARRTQYSLADRLGVRWPCFSLFSLVGFLLGSVPVFFLSLLAVYLVGLVVPSGGSLEVLYENMTTPWAIVFIVAIGVIPGIGEELFFRGYLQRRLIQRCGPWVAIGVTSIVFGLFHIAPQSIALATVIGVWLGVMAWRTNSIWPGACCHAFINSGWNIYQIGRVHWGIPDVPPLWFSIVGGVVVLVAFVASIRVFCSMKTASVDADSL